MSAIVAKVMNSTVGTSTVKALDTILKESDAANVEKLNTYMTTIANNAADRLYNKLKTDVKLVGSDEVIYHYSGTWKLLSNESYLQTTQGVSFSHNGTVKLKTVQCNESSGSNKYEISVYKDSTSNSRYAQTGIVTVPAYQTVEMSLSFNVTAGTKYYIEIYSNLDDGQTRDLDFCGSLSQFSPTATLATS